MAMRITQAIDVGNYTTYSLREDDASTPWGFKSVLADLIGREIDVKPGNVIIRSPEYGVFHIGEQARRYGAASHELLDRGGKLKPENFIPLVLATLGPVNKQRVTTYEVDLYWSLPDPDMVIMGTDQYGNEAPVSAAEYLAHSMNRNFKYGYRDHTGDYDMSVSIHAQPCRPEGLDAVLFAREDGYLPAHGTILGADIGGGTLEMVTLDSDNVQLMRDSYDGKNGGALAGVIAIAGQIAKSIELQEAVGGYPNLGLIMDALANPKPAQISGYYYEYPLDFNETFDFTKVAQKVISSYWLEIQTKCHNKFYSSTGGAGMAGYMFFGGGANIFRQPLSKTNGIYIPENPELSNVRALYRFSQRSAAVVRV